MIITAGPSLFYKSLGKGKKNDHDAALYQLELEIIHPDSILTHGTYCVCVCVGM